MDIEVNDIYQLIGGDELFLILDKSDVHRVGGNGKWMAGPCAGSIGTWGGETIANKSMWRLVKRNGSTVCADCLKE